MALSQLGLLLALNWILSFKKLVNLMKVTLKEVQSLIGLLNFAFSVVRPSRAFLRRLIDLALGIRSPEQNSIK